MNDFFKDNRQVSSQIIQQMAIEAPKALSLWLGLKNIANGYGICVASQTALEGLLHSKSRTTVYYAVKYLSDKGYIKVGKIGNQNAYILNPNIVERLPYDTSKHTLSNHGIVFRGTIALTREENPKLYKEFKDFIKKNPSPKLRAINKLRFKAKASSNKRHEAKSKAKRREASKIKRWIKNRKYTPIYNSKAKAKRYHAGYQQRLFLEQKKTANKR